VPRPIICDPAANDGAKRWSESRGGIDAGCRDSFLLALKQHNGRRESRVAEVMQGPDDGLLARFIWFWPDPFPFNKPNRPPAADWAITAFDRLRTLDLAADEDGSTPLLVMLDDAAAQRLVRFAQLMQERKEMTIGKARGLVLQLSLVLEYLRWCGEDGYTALQARSRKTP
jgi:hypothetical protein